MKTDEIKSLLAKWRTRFQEFEQQLETVDAMTAAGKGLADPTSSKLIFQARQNELGYCIDSLESLL